jgi:hypothetical protein
MAGGRAGVDAQLSDQYPPLHIHQYVPPDVLVWSPQVAVTHLEGGIVQGPVTGPPPATGQQVRGGVGSGHRIHSCVWFRYRADSKK